MMINRKRSMVLASSLLGSASLFSITAHANPAVFFNDDLNAGLQTFLDTAAAADAAYNSANPSGPTQSSLIFQLDLSTITGYRFAVTDTLSSQTVYVQTLRAGSAATNTGTGDEGGDGFTNWSVSYLSGDFSSAVSAGYELSFFSDATYTTPYLINAVGLNVSDWGTCCTTNNTTPDGSLANASQIYMLFDGSSPLLVGGIDAPIAGEEHFVAAIDDRNAFSSVTMVPNGTGEYFGAGGYLVFSTLALNSVPAGSSVVTVGSKIGASDTATPDDLDDGSYDPTLDGGTLQFTEDGSVGNDLTVESGGTLDTGSYDVELSGVISGTNSGPLVKTGSGSLLLTGTNSFDGGYQIQGGTLIGSTTSLTGDVLNNADLVIDQDTDGSFGGDVSGSGMLTKDGTGAVTLTGTNSYTGGTTIAGGTLIGSTTSLTGDVLNNASLVIDQDTDGSFAGDVSGSGTLTKDGSGAVTLTGTNSYTGGTTIAGGTLIGSTTSLTGDVLNNASLVIDQDTDGSFAGDVSGSGMLTKDGTGAVTLTGTNSYTGGTTIAGGTLIGSTTSLTGDVLNNASLVIDQDTGGSFAGDISGSGALTKDGTGAVTLTGTNSYSGGTTIAGGTLIGSTTSLTGDVLNNASLVIDQDTDGSFAGDVSGTGTLTKDGSGAVTLTGTNSYTGGTTVAGGTLNIEGYLTGSRVLVQNAARLTGHGVVGGISAASGATIAPAGAAIGTLMVDGDIDFAPGSTLEINANADGEADLLAATGNVTISGGTVQVLAADGDYAPQTSYTILSGESVEGSFDDVETDLAFLMPTLSYRANGVGLLLTRNDVQFADVAETTNQIEVGSALNDAFAAESALYYAVVGQSAAGAREIFDNLSGEVHATVANALVQDGDRTRRAILGRIDTPRPSGLNLWLQGAGARDEWSSDRNASGYDRNSAGLLGGLDLQTGSWVVGAAAGYSDGKLHIDQRLSQASVSGLTASAYAGTKLGPVSLSFGTQYADYDIDTDRSMVLSDIDQSVSGEYDAETFGAFARAGFKIPVGNGAIEPFIGVNWSRFERGGFAESGGTLALDAAAEKADWTFGSIGFKSIVPLDPGSPFSVSMSAEWQHALGDRDAEATLSFSEGEAFTIAGAPLARDAALADLALNYRLADRIMAGLGYQGTIADYGMTNAVRASLSIGF